MEELIPLFKALSDRNRLRVIAALMGRDELCACQITELLQVTGATASRHMGVLLRAGLINSRKDGRWVYYRMEKDTVSFLPVLNWIKREFENDPDMESDKKKLALIYECDPEELCRKQRGEKCCPVKNSC
ncbi:MAG: metalloregulator ArsR/SmtB family transcription factor [Kiritimatiellae bacterium]|jgi:ArsR family transcriptional regulator|nr:metalloregulator ArsR/SmtB family transcription factor [Kiritimatiellia bacterium]